MISCIVYGDPEPNVRWYRETMVLARNENRLVEQFGIRHRLVIASVSQTDFGNYSCLAENDLGKSRGFIHLSGKKGSHIYVKFSSTGEWGNIINFSVNFTLSHVIKM